MLLAVLMQENIHPDFISQINTVIATYMHDKAASG